MSEPTKPIPVADDFSSGFWDAAAQGRLVVQRCGSCGFLSYPPSLVCLRCRCDPPTAGWHEVSGRGHLKTWTVMRDSFLPGFDDELPFVIADIELAEQPGLRIVARLTDIELDDLELGMPLKVAFGDPVGQTRVPHFVRDAS